MIQRPFPIRYHRSEEPGVVEVCINFSDTDETPDEIICALDDLFTTFERFGSVGGFAGDKLLPTHSGISLRGHTLRGDGQISWRFEEANVDPGVVFLIANLVHRFSIDETAVSGLTVVHSLCNTEAPLTQFPSAFFSPLPFSFENVTEGTRVVLGLEFRDEQPDDRRIYFLKVWEAWLKLAQAGAFSDDHYGPDVSGVLVVDLPQSLPTGMMFVHERTRLPNSGVSCLINALHFMHIKVAKLEEVVLS